MLKSTAYRTAPALAVLLLAIEARAQEQPVTAKLLWRDGPTGSNCISGVQLRKEVEARLGRQVFAGTAAVDVHVHGGVSRSGDSWLVEIRLTAAHGQPMGERELESTGSDCSSLDDSLALVLAVMLDIPKERVPPPAQRSGQSATPAPAVQHEPTPALRSRLRVPESTPPRRPAWQVELGLGPTLALGLLPKPSMGGRAFMAIDPPEFWKLGLDFGFYRSVDEAVDGTGARASFSPAELGIFVCPVSMSVGSFDVDTCLTQHVGRLRVEGSGFDSNQQQDRSYVNAGVAANASLAISGPVFVRLALGLETPLVVESFRYGHHNGAQPRLFRMSWALATGQIGLGAGF